MNAICIIDAGRFRHTACLARLAGTEIFVSNGCTRIPPERNQVSLEAADCLAEGYRYLDCSAPDFAKAERSFLQAIDFYTDFAEAILALGLILRQRDKLDEAYEILSRAMSLLPSDPRPLIALGSVLGKLKRYGEAVTFLEEGIKLKPTYAEADAKLILAEIYEQLHRLDKASHLWRQVAKMDALYPSFDLPVLEAKEKLASYGLAE